MILTLVIEVADDALVLLNSVITIEGQPARINAIQNGDVPTKYGQQIIALRNQLNDQFTDED